MAIARTTLQTVLGIALLVGIAAWLLSPDWPFLDPFELAPAGGKPPQVRVLNMDWSIDTTTGLALARGDVDGGSLLLLQRSGAKRGTHIVETGERQVWKAALSADGSAAFVFGDSGTVSRIDLSSEVRTGLLDITAGGAVTELAAAPDGSAFAIAVDTEVFLCDPRNGQVLERLPPSSAQASSLDFSGDSLSVAVGTDSGSIRVWDRTTGRLVQTFSGRKGPISGVQFVSGTSHLASIGVIDGLLQVYDLTTGDSLWHAATDHGGAHALAVSPDGRLAVTGGSDRQIALWDLQTHKRVRTFAGHSGAIRALRFSADGKEIFSAGDSTICAWSVADTSDSQPVRVESIELSNVLAH